MSSSHQAQTSPGVSSNSSSMSNSSLSGSSNHWSQKKHESVLDFSKLSQIDLEKLLLTRLQGGSENGQFVYLSSEFEPAYLNFSTNSRLAPNEIVLEIQSNKISGYTLFDCIDLLGKLYKSNKAITFRSVRYISQHLQHDLRPYLDARFHKGSIDYDLQQTIRENVYMRTVPCTTRLPRTGEINGQDYIFLSDEQFLELEQSGELLEYGVYNGHYYGTPKPPRRAINLLSTCSSQLQSPKISDINSKRNQSLNMMHNNVQGMIFVFFSMNGSVLLF
ncbi:membrane-associated guanylate WW and PDZ domain-containing 2 [Brachionus plicatilis]|uniref:Membrane-associated guanylate WW and PDZ domain-containing 2 n=1 Tax=Brachionus plicatilis TaxID=10195 RepID=A0A3M7SQG6_BRAPC|nr:membrane-associated guanylate WW and PDZ domain-containing 2 [Brachionus plicatilis]